MKKYSQKQLNYWESLRGRKLTEEVKKKMSVSAKKSKNSGRFKNGHKVNLGRKRPEMAGNQFGFKKGQVAWNKGIKATKEARRKMSEVRIGKPAYWNKEEKSACWKGDDVGYSGIHYWVRKYKGKPIKCFECGVKGKKIGHRWNIEWANVDHKYKRNLDDYIALCCKCHQQYDCENNNFVPIWQRHTV